MSSERKPRILVVDDSTTMCSLVSTTLMRLGFEVSAAQTVEGAIDLARKSRFEVVLTDLIMPGMGGIKGIRFFKKEFPGMAVVAMSGGTHTTGAASLLAKARAAGADCVLEKPFTREALEKVVMAEMMRGGPDGDRRQRVLVVDDSNTIRKLLTRTLETNGFEAVDAGTMEDALGSHDIVGLDLVVTDIFMPGKGGIAGIKAIRKHWPEVRIVAMSGGHESLGGDEVLAAARKSGADFALKKPFSMDRFVQTVESALF